MKWIRWYGLIPFVLIVLGLTLFFWLFLDGLVKDLIESQGSKMVGAKVELQSAQVDLLPLRLHLRGLQVTDPKDVMTNMVTIDDLRFELNSAQLLFGKVIIDEMKVAGVRLRQPRSHSGKLAVAVQAEEEQKAAAKTKADAASDEGGLQLPDAKTLVAKESKHLQEQQTQWQQDLKEVEARWKTVQAGLPDSAKLAGYQKRADTIKAMPEGNALQKVAKAQAQLKLLKDVQADVKRIQKARDTMNADLKLLQKSYTALRNAPSQDLAAISKKYQFNAQGSINASQLLFGDNQSDWVQYGLKIYAYIAPLLFSDSKDEAPEVKHVRSQGVDVRFREYHPLPGFLISKVFISTELPDGKYQGQVLNITSNQAIIGRTTTFELKGQELAKGESARLFGQFNHLDARAPVDEFHYVVRGRQLKDHNFIRRPGLSIIFATGIEDTTLHAYKRGKQLDVSYRQDYSQLLYRNQAGKDSLSQLLATTMADIPAFYLNTTVQGPWRQPHIGLQTDLNKKLSAGVRKIYEAQVEQFQAQLRQELEQANKANLEAAQASLQQLQQQGDKATAELESKFRDLDKQISH